MKGIDLEQVADVVVASFDQDDFDQLLRFKFDFKRQAEVGDGPLRTVVFRVLTKAENSGWEPMLIAEVAAARPLRADVQRVFQQYARGLISAIKAQAVEENVQKAYQRFGLSPNVRLQQVGQNLADQPATDSGLERIVRDKLPFLDVALWRERLFKLEGRVCRIELNDAVGTMGTGFLVGPDALLTNYHVVKPVIDAPALAANVCCRFDYKKLFTGADSDGSLVKLHPNDWLIDRCPYTAAEAADTPDAAAATPDELDFALLRLERGVGAAPVSATIPGSPVRGWIRVPVAAPALNQKMPILILQHPAKQSLKLAMDTEGVTELKPFRVRYATNTEGGSSGSPCFNMDWQLVALHHYGDPAFGQPKYNQGVPIIAIRERLVRVAKAAALGGEPPD